MTVIATVKCWLKHWKQQGLPSSKYYPDGSPHPQKNTICRTQNATLTNMKMRKSVHWFGKNQHGNQLFALRN